MKKKRSIFLLVLALILILLLSYSVTRALMIYIPQHRAQKEFDQIKESVLVTDSTTPQTQPEGPAENQQQPQVSVGVVTAEEEAKYRFELLAQQNRDFVGWITIPDTLIDYPVMKSSEDNPEYYIRRDFYGNYSLAGCLFIGYGCNADSDCFIIYGHNMKNKTMFGSLNRYADNDFAASHSEIRFYTPGGERLYRVFAAFQTKVYDDKENVFKYYDYVGQLDKGTYDYVVASVRSMSLPKITAAPVYPQQILFLSTCSYHTENGRFVVAAYRVQ